MFKHTFQLLLVACLATGTLRAANDPFVGDWKFNPSRSKLTDQMKVQSIAANKYAFDFGDGSAEVIAVNGTDQPGNFGGTFPSAVVGDAGEHERDWHSDGAGKHWTTFGG